MPIFWATLYIYIIQNEHSIIDERNKIYFLLQEIFSDDGLISKLFTGDNCCQ